MRRLTLGLLAMCLLLSSPFVTAAESEEHVARIEGLGRLWGKVMLHHPWVPTRELDWDSALEESLRVLAANDTDDGLVEAVDALLGALGDPLTERLDSGAAAVGDEKPASAYPVIDPDRLLSMKRLDDGTVVLALNDHRRMINELRSAQQQVREAFQRVRTAERVVLDLRGRADKVGFMDSLRFNSGVRDLLGELTDEDIFLPTLRRRIHNGFRPQRPGGTSGAYYSGFIVPDHDVIAAAAPEGERPGRLVILVNDTNLRMADVIVGMQSAGLAEVVVDGDADFDLSTNSPIVVCDEITVLVRGGEMLLPNGATVFEPDARTTSAENDDNDNDEALQLAVSLTRSEVSTSAPDSFDRAAYAAAPGWFDAHTDDPYPDRERRLMGLFRLWCVLEAMHPYLDLLDYDWEDVLTEMIPLFEEAPDALAYHRAAARIMALTQDTHSGAYSFVLSAAQGYSAPSVLVRYIENRPVIVYVNDPTLDLAAGDVLMAINDEPIESIVKRLQPYIAYSTPQSLRYRLGSRLLSGSGSTSKLLVEKADGSQQIIEAPLDSSFAANYQASLEASRPQVITELESGIAYVDLVQLESPQVSHALKTIRAAGKAIIDIRGYPKGTVFEIAPMLAGRGYDAAHFERPIRMSLNGRDAQFSYDQHLWPATAAESFDGELVILINEAAISHAEHSCLLLDTAVENVTFIGSPTQGANGDITGFFLPGGIQVNFTGQAVSHMSGAQLQRVGVQPDIHVEPTIAGIREGRDEVLEAAVEYLRGNR